MFRQIQTPELNTLLGLSHILRFVGLALRDFLGALGPKEKGNTSHPKLPTTRIYQSTMHNIPANINLRTGIIYRKNSELNINIYPTATKTNTGLPIQNSVHRDYPHSKH